MNVEKKKGSELYVEIKNVALELDMTYKTQCICSLHNK